MDYVVDKVTEDSFYENLLLGLPKVLNHKIGITSTNLSRFSPASETELSLWETNYGVPLPADMRTFYSASNGFNFLWKFSADETENREPIIGQININHLLDLIPVYGYETRSEPSVAIVNGRFDIKLTLESKIFELVPIGGAGKVVLVYINAKYSPTLWLFTAKRQFYFLADDFTTYMRMAIAHLGIPNWQFVYTPKGVPQWSEQLFRIMAPHLMPLNKKLEKMKEKKMKSEMARKIPINVIDPNVFKQSADSEDPSKKTERPPPTLKLSETQSTTTTSSVRRKTSYKLKPYAKCTRKYSKIKKC